MATVFAPIGPLTVSVNGGPEFTVGEGSKGNGREPGGIVSGTPPQFGWMPIGPNIFGVGNNQLSVTPKIPGFDMPPKNFTVVVPPNTIIVGDSLQLYLMLDWTLGTVTWAVCISGKLVSIGNSEHGQMPWPMVPPAV